MRIIFNKVDEFIRVYDGNRYLVLFGLEKYGAIYSRIRYLISQKGGMNICVFSYYVNIKVDSYESLLIEKKLTLHNVVILIKSVLNKDHNYYYNNTLLEKCSYHLAKK